MVRTSMQCTCSRDVGKPTCFTASISADWAATSREAPSCTYPRRRRAEVSCGSRSESEVSQWLMSASRGMTCADMLFLGTCSGGPDGRHHPVHEAHQLRQLHVQVLPAAVSLAESMSFCDAVWLRPVHRSCGIILQHCVEHQQHSVSDAAYGSESFLMLCRVSVCSYPTYIPLPSSEVQRIRCDQPRGRHNATLPPSACSDAGLLDSMHE
jgi:hypothetical protein